MAADDQVTQAAWSLAATVFTYFCQKYSKLSTRRVGYLMSVLVISVCGIQIEEGIL